MLRRDPLTPDPRIPDRRRPEPRHPEAAQHQRCGHCNGSCEVREVLIRPDPTPRADWPYPLAYGEVPPPGPRTLSVLALWCDACSCHWALAPAVELPA